MTNDYSLSDVASVVRNNDDLSGFGGGAWWLIVLFLFAFTGNGWGRNNNGEPVTEAAQEARINQLELAQQMANVVRYPTAYAYSAGPSPFCGGCCQNV